MTLRQSTFVVLAFGLICVVVLAMGGGRGPRSQASRPEIEMLPVNLSKPAPTERQSVFEPLRFM